MKKIGILSGTFDPIHDGHLNFAIEAIEKCNLDKVFFLAEPRPRRKQGVKAFEHRIAMINLALKHNKKFGSVILEQARFTPRSTLPLLRSRFKGAQLFMLMGDDMLDHLASWPNVAELVNSVHFIIGTRKRSVDEIEKLISALERTRGLKFEYTVFKASGSELASSSVRLSLRRSQIPSGINSDVLKYIEENSLYSLSAK